VTPQSFRQSCRDRLEDLLAEHGFSEEPLPDDPTGNEYQCRFVTSATRIILEGVHWGRGVDVAQA